MSDNTEQNSPTTQETHEGEAPATSSPRPNHGSLLLGFDHRP